MSCRTPGRPGDYSTGRQTNRDLPTRPLSAKTPATPTPTPPAQRSRSIPRRPPRRHQRRQPRQPAGHDRYGGADRFFFEMLDLPPQPPLFPYTTLFRSDPDGQRHQQRARLRREGSGQQQRRDHLDRCRAEHREDLETTRLDARQIAIYLPVPCLQKHRQHRRQHRQPSGHARYRAAPPAGTNGANPASQPVTIDTAAPTASFSKCSISPRNLHSSPTRRSSDLTLTVNGTNSALGSGEKVQVSSNGGTTWTDVVQNTGKTWRLLDWTPDKSRFTYPSPVCKNTGNTDANTASPAVTLDTAPPPPPAPTAPTPPASRSRSIRRRRPLLFRNARSPPATSTLPLHDALPI